MFLCSDATRTGFHLELSISRIGCARCFYTWSFQLLLLEWKLCSSSIDTTRTGSHLDLSISRIGFGRCFNTWSFQLLLLGWKECSSAATQLGRGLTRSFHYLELVVEGVLTPGASNFCCWNGRCVPLQSTQLGQGLTWIFQYLEFVVDGVLTPGASNFCYWGGRCVALQRRN